MGAWLLQSSISKPCCNEHPIHVDLRIPSSPLSTWEGWIGRYKCHPEKVQRKIKVVPVNVLAKLQEGALNVVQETAPVLFILIVKASFQGKKGEHILQHNFLIIYPMLDGHEAGA